MTDMFIMITLCFNMNKCLEMSLIFMKIIVIIPIYFCGYACVSEIDKAPCNCGRFLKPNSRIWNGKNTTDFGRYPWHIQIKTRGHP